MFSEWPATDLLHVGKGGIIKQKHETDKSIVCLKLILMYTVFPFMNIKIVLIIDKYVHLTPKQRFILYTHSHFFSTQERCTEHTCHSKRLDNKLKNQQRGIEEL